MYSNSQQVTLPRQWIFYCSASLYVPLRIEGHLHAQSVRELFCSAKHRAAHVSNLKGSPTCRSVLPDAMLISVVELAATGDLTLHPIRQHRFLGQGTDVVGKDEDITFDVGSHAGCG